MINNNIIHSTNYRAELAINDSTIRSVDIFKKAKNTMYSFFAPAGNRDTMFHSHVYDLYEYGRIIDTEAFVARAFNKKRSLMFKYGYEIIGHKENADYIKRRFAEISYVSGVPFDLFLKETANNLITFHNAYVLIVRKEESSSGKTRIINENEIEPIAAYFNLPPETIEVKVDNAGNVVKYRQYVSSSKYREYNPSDIIHIHYNKRTGFIMGTPPLEPVKDDILALRRIEESIETLIYKSLFPIIHVKVGTEKSPAKRYPDGTSEVNIAHAYLRQIEDSGGLVTNERVELKSIGAESIALRVESYLQHFKSRVFIGLGMSGIDFGEGDSTGRATGEVLSESLKESVMDYQETFANFLSYLFIKPLLVESGKYKAEYLIKEDEMVWFKFGNLDISGMMKIESHELNKYTQGVLTLKEVRNKFNLEELSEEEIIREKELFNYTGLEKEAAKYASAQSSGSSTNNINKSKGSLKKKSGSSNLTKSISTPKNQHSDSVEARIIKVLNSGSTMKNSRVYSLLLDEICDIIGSDEIIVDNIILDNLLIGAASNIIDSYENIDQNKLNDFITMSILSLLNDFA